LISKDALQYVAELGEKRHQQVNGIAYYRKDDGSIEQLLSPIQVASPLEVHSLSGLAAYMASELDEPKSPGAGAAVVVDGPECVRLLSSLMGPFRQREVLAVAKPYLSQPFAYGRFVDIETFITALQAQFVQDEQTATILRVVGNITQEAVQVVADDGVSQQVAVRAGITRASNAVVPNPVTLRPFRTFAELPQPESKFVLRLRRNEDELPSATLFETGDTQWKGVATALIKTHLDKLLDEAGVKVPVFA
jgi:hypothetical protein